jgi:hypothetical protein
MKTDEHNKTEELINRFFEGETSQEEEKELYRFFSEEEVPESLLPYQKLFGYFDHDMAAELQPVKITLPRRKSLRNFWIGIAASLLIAGLSTLFFPKKTETFNEFEGSYIIRNGIRITDPDIIRPELESALQQALQKLDDADRLSRQLTCRYEEAVQRFPDEYTQEVARTLLGIN